MEYIHPKSRFSKKAKSLSVPASTMEEAIRKFGKVSPSSEARLLSGGFRNANFLVSDDKDNYVFRISSNGSRAAQVERDLLKFLRSTNVRVPEIYAEIEAAASSVTVMEFVDGVTLEDGILSDKVPGTKIYEELGRQLAQIHRVRFEKAGFFGPSAVPGGEYENSGVFLKEYIDKSWAGLESRKDRIDPEANRRVRRLLDDKWEMVLETEKARELVHCDFNPKNILVSKTGDEVLAILDWEFSWVGNGLMDFGNFFRFAYDYPLNARERFVDAYREVNSALPPNWEDVARLIDLGNMCFFLERPEDCQESFRTARTVVESALERFGY